MSPKHEKKNKHEENHFQGENIKEGTVILRLWTVNIINISGSGASTASTSSTASTASTASTRSTTVAGSLHLVTGPKIPISKK